MATAYSYVSTNDWLMAFENSYHQYCASIRCVSEKNILQNNGWDSDSNREV